MNIVCDLFLISVISGIALKASIEERLDKARVVSGLTYIASSVSTVLVGMIGFLAA